MRKYRTFSPEETMRVAEILGVPEERLFDERGRALELEDVCE